MWQKVKLQQHLKLKLWKEKDKSTKLREKCFPNYCDKTQSSNCDKNIMMRKVKNSICEKKKNSNNLNLDKSQKLKLWHNSNA